MQGLRLALLRSLNQNQLLILSNAKGATTITPLLSRLSERFQIPLSTLKLNSKILKELGLIEFNDTPAKATPAGRLVLDIIGEAYCTEPY